MIWHGIHWNCQKLSAMRYRTPVYWCSSVAAQEQSLYIQYTVTDLQNQIISLPYLLK
jgi:hypothetical protein